MDINYRLENVKTNNLKTLKTEIESGAKFIVFNYRVGLGFVSLLRFSPAIFIAKEEEFNKYLKKYNILNLLFGPWFIFKGPFLTYNTYKTNKGGGIDVTKDVILNLTEKQLQENKVCIAKLHNIFTKTSKNDLKEITKVFSKMYKKSIFFKDIYAGLFINVKEYEEPYLVIGVYLNEGVEFDKEYIKEHLYKRFYKHVHFEIMDLSKNEELAKSLIEQGEKIRL